jgi:predicted DNA-binding protein (MmcQ/YjbR family)
MTYEEFNTFCGALPATTHVVQWGGAQVWKVGGKVFAVGGWDRGAPAISFKVSEVAFEMLKERPGLRPAPYLASRGLKWIQHYAKPGLGKRDLRDYIRQSHSIVSAGLPMKKQLALGLVTKA